jgi:hypothetical protein
LLPAATACVQEQHRAGGAKSRFCYRAQWVIDLAMPGLRKVIAIAQEKRV